MFLYNKSFIITKQKYLNINISTLIFFLTHMTLLPIIFHLTQQFHYFLYNLLRKCKITLQCEFFDTETTQWI